MDLAVGVIIGAAFGKIVESIVNDLIRPIVGAVFGGFDFSNLFVALGAVPEGVAMTLAEVKKAGVPVFAYGSFLTILLNFLILAFIVFILVKQINRLKKQSVRIPASLCGIVGLKPTYGRVSRAGVVPLAWSLDHIGPMTRTVTDAALLLQALAGHDPADPSTAAVEVPDYRRASEADPRGLRVDVVREVFFEHLHPDVRAAVEGAVRALEGLGIRVEEIRLPRLHHAGPATFAIITAESMAYHEPYLKTRAAEYGADVRARLLTGQFVLATQYLKAQRARQVLRAEVDGALSAVDALLLPTTPIPAPRTDEREATVDGVREDVRAWLTRCTRPINLTGHPALSLPGGLTADGLPVGLQLVGRHFDEATLLRLGRAYEAVSPLRDRRPSLAA